MRKAFLLLFVLAVPGSAQWKRDGKPLPDLPWRKSGGTFGVMLVLSDEPEKVVKDWNRPEQPQVKSIAVAERGKPIAAFVFFVGCKELGGKCNATVDFTVLRPDGSEYASLKAGELWKGKPAPPDPSIQLSLDYLGVRIEPTDPAGKYVVKAVAHDLNARRSIEVQQTFTVTK